VIRDALSLLGRSIDRRIELDMDLGAEQCTLRGDRHQLQNMVLNLVINAAHAMPEGGMVRITTGLAALDAAYCEASSFALVPGPYIVLSVSDTGCGISPEVLGRIFDPFFTTREGGTGLGLSAVYGTVLDHHGEITVTSRPGAGSVFCMHFPVAGEPVAGGGEPGQPVPGAGTILLIDDEPLVRETGQALLEQLGYTVLTAADGPEGIALFRKRHRQIVLVILDMIMPRMGGRETFFELKKITPACPIAISSGYSSGDDLQQLLEAGAAGLIAKPYDHRELSTLVAGMVAGRE
jgi:CheY-like chemotaxis protein